MDALLSIFPLVSLWQVREGLLQDTVRQVTARGERRARLLQAVTEKAEEQARVWRDYHRLARDNTQLRRDLQVSTYIYTPPHLVSISLLILQDSRKVLKCNKVN